MVGYHVPYMRAVLLSNQKPTVVLSESRRAGTSRRTCICPSSLGLRTSAEPTQWVGRVPNRAKKDEGS
jgi:hypothetical protein